MDRLKNNESGFSVIEGLLIILVLAMVGFGGYYVYHTQKHASTKATTVSTTTPYDKSEQATRYLKIPELGIQLPLPTQISDLTYEKVENIDGTMGLESASVLGTLYHQVDAACPLGPYPIFSGWLTKNAPSQEEGTQVTTTLNGNTYYLYSKGGSTGCYSTETKPTATQQAKIDSYMNAVYTAVTRAKVIQ